MIDSDNKHLWVVYPLAGLAAFALLAAVLIPVFQWALSTAGFVTIFGAVVVARKQGFLRGRSGALAAALLGLFGICYVQGFLAEYARRQMPAQLSKPVVLPVASTSAAR